MKKTMLVCLLVLIALAFNLPVFAQNIKDGLIAYWSFDGDAKDSSGNANNGTIAGAPTFDTGKFGKAIGFGASGDSVAVKANEPLKLREGKFSVSAYIKPASTDHGAILYHGLGCSTWASWFLGMQGAEPDAPLVANNVVFGVRTSNGSAYTAVSTDASSFVKKWVHVAVTHDGSNMTLYIDGKQVKQTSTKDIPYDSQEQLYIGGDTGCGGRAWFKNSSLDEVRLYNRALTDKEVAILTTGGLAVEPSDKLALTWGEVKVR
jgi:hypothetical protein